MGMDEQTSKQPYLADVPQAEKAPKGKSAPTRKKTNKTEEPVLMNNDFLDPPKNPYLWLGFLLVPLVVALFAYLQGFFTNDPDDVNNQPVIEQALQQPNLTPEQRKNLERLKARSEENRRIRRMRSGRE